MAKGMMMCEKREGGVTTIETNPMSVPILPQRLIIFLSTAINNRMRHQSQDIHHRNATSDKIVHTPFTYGTHKQSTTAEASRVIFNIG